MMFYIFARAILIAACTFMMFYHIWRNEYPEALQYFLMIAISAMLRDEQ